MAKAADAALFAGVVVLLALAMGASLAGVGPNGYFFPFPTQTRGIHHTSGPPPPPRTTVTRTGSGGSVSEETTSTTSVETTGENASWTGSGVVPPGVSLPDVFMGPFGWYVGGAVVALLGGLMAAALLRLQKPRVVDLRGEVEEMERERNRFVGGWTARLRNAAILRYYSLMANVCATVGIVDRPPYTPREFVGFASAELEVPETDATRFADIVDRAHYGAELTSEEVGDATKFMDAFTRGVAGRLGIE